ncbi:MAG: hypothetical protein GC138_01495 [Gammaproteobacteria bacterium]|nr:hypothetical protein [Gammaproteobacteria bacterium]
MRCESSVTQLLKFLVVSFFTFTVFVWYGGFLMLLLGLWVGLSEFLGEHILGAALGIPVSFLLVAWFCGYIADKTRFFVVFQDVGQGLIGLGVRCVAGLSGKDQRPSAG